jgi:hypothetical protein
MMRVPATHRQTVNGENKAKEEEDVKEEVEERVEG